MQLLRTDLERSWARTVLMLSLLVVLFALLKHASWGTAAPEPEAPAAHVQSVQTVPIAPKGLLFPLPGHERSLRDNFHEKRGMREHKALDIMAPRGTPVRAVDDGRIAKLYRGPMAGIAVYQFDRATTRVYFYAHLDRYAASLEEGREVVRGEVIGYVGSTGNAPESAPHLHFAIHELEGDTRWWKGRAVNPYPLLREAADSKDPR